MVLVSIIVPVFNEEKYINRCIDSMINQSLKDIEMYSQLYSLAKNNGADILNIL